MSEACCKHAHVPYIMSDRAIKKEFLFENFGDTATFEHMIEANILHQKEN